MTKDFPHPCWASSSADIGIARGTVPSDSRKRSGLLVNRTSDKLPLTPNSKGRSRHSKGPRDSAKAPGSDILMDSQVLRREVSGMQLRIEGALLPTLSVLALLVRHQPLDEPCSK